jgi:hypothetical protein
MLAALGQAREALWKEQMAAAFQAFGYISVGPATAASCGAGLPDCNHQQGKTVMSRGHIVRRGRASFRLRFQGEPDPVTNKRKTVYVTVKGRRTDAKRELTRLLAARDSGTLVDPTDTTIGMWFGQRLADPGGLAPRTIERYRQFLIHQILPHLGGVALQRLRVASPAARRFPASASPARRRDRTPPR